MNKANCCPCNISNLAYPLLNFLPICFNVGNDHYISGLDVGTTSSLLCVEKCLTNFSCYFKANFGQCFK